MFNVIMSVFICSCPSKCCTFTLRPRASTGKWIYFWMFFFCLFLNLCVCIFYAFCNKQLYKYGANWIYLPAQARHQSVSVCSFVCISHLQTINVEPGPPPSPGQSVPGHFLGLWASSCLNNCPIVRSLLFNTRLKNKFRINWGTWQGDLQWKP